MELSPEQRAALLSLTQSARAQLEAELELGMPGLGATPPVRPQIALPVAAPVAASAVRAAGPRPEPAPGITEPLPTTAVHGQGGQDGQDRQNGQNAQNSLEGGVQPASPEERRRVLQTLAAEAAQCKACVLHEKRNKSVFSRGSPDAELVFVGEGPGRDEDLQGLPFVGAAGQLLDRMIAAMGYGRDEVYICNVVKCRPPENRTPRPEEALACSRFLVPQLTAVGPKVIVALGRCAAQALGVAEAMGPWRGRWGAYRGIEVMPTYHPAYLLRSPEQKRTVWADLQLVMARLGKSPPARR